MSGRSERGKREKFTEKLLRPYALIARRTTDLDAKAAILGLIEMVLHATTVMEQYDMGAKVNPQEEAFLDQALAAIEADDDEALARLRAKYQ